MNCNREYSKCFGTGLMALGLAILVIFGSFLLNFDVWGEGSHTFLPYTLLVAFSSVGSFFTGVAFRRGVFLMSEQVIKPCEKKATPGAAA
jgi:hypothetical protein